MSTVVDRKRKEVGGDSDVSITDEPPPAVAKKPMLAKFILNHKCSGVLSQRLPDLEETEEEEVVEDSELKSSGVLSQGLPDLEEKEEEEVVEDSELKSSDCNVRERCYVHTGGKINRSSWKRDGRDKCACPECLEEKRRHLEDVKYAHLPEPEKKMKTYVEMGAFFCTPCIRHHIANNIPFVRMAENGTVKALIGSVK
jgi:hypothetical protein